MREVASMAKIVVLGAFRIEVEQVVNQLENQEELCEEGPLKYVTGIYENKRVLVGVTGLGKVRAAAGTQAAIHVFQPDLIVMCGTAGSLSEEVHALDLVVARHLLQHDTGPHEPEPISADPGCSAGLESAARTALRGTTHAVHTGTLVTGDRPVIDPATRAALFDRFHA
ncbi:MAG: 5'-methylthioadenosine/S-adenosylhomocysteine nucleosidase, partial [Planctomycetota bacterium]